MAASRGSLRVVHLSDLHLTSEETAARSEPRLWGRLTGMNAAQHVGRHMLGLPGPRLRPLLERESLFLKLRRAGRRATFASPSSRSCTVNGDLLPNVSFLVAFSETSRSSREGISTR